MRENRHGEAYAARQMLHCALQMLSGGAVHHAKIVASCIIAENARGGALC